MCKIILYKGKYSSSTDARYTLHWLPIKDRILYKILCLALKCTHGLGPSYLNEMFVQNILQRRLRSNSTNEITYIVPRNKNKTFGDGVLVSVDHMSGIISQMNSNV